jgi:HTH-type transcriptional regulator / antitoxin HigA
MNVKPIRSKADYEAHLARISALMDAPTGTDAADELEVLATLIERYENEQFPVELPTPVEAIRFRMDQMGLEPRDLEPILGSRSRVSEVLSGARPLSIILIRALNRHLGIPAEVLIQEDPPPATKEPAQLSLPATKQLVAMGLLKTRESLENLLARVPGGMPAPAMLRKTRTARTNAKTDQTALQAWCAAALIRSQSVQVRGQFQRDKLDATTRRAVARLSVQSKGPKVAREVLSDLGIALVILPHLAGTHLDGAAMRRADGVPVVALTLRRDRIDNFWFTLLHELAHVAEHLTEERDVIFDDLEIGSTEKIETDADRLAEEALIPAGVWETLRKDACVRVADVEAIAARSGVNVAIVAGRWQQRHRDFRRFSKLLGHGEIRPQFPEFAIQ